MIYTELNSRTVTGSPLDAATFARDIRKGIILDKLIFSQSGIYRLQQLAAQVHHITGIRHKLSNEMDMLEMLRDCAQSDHKIIQTYYEAFSSELDSVQRSGLLEHGIYPAPELAQTH